LREKQLLCRPRDGFERGHPVKSFYKSQIHKIGS
jgi:hypothetical protein